MKYIFHLPLLFIFISGCAQDSLFLKSDTVYAVTVIGKNLKKVIYRKWNNTDSAIYSMPLSMVKFIKYSIDSVPEDTVLPPLLLDVTYLIHGSTCDVGMYNKGEHDAWRYYNRKGGAATAVFVGTLLSGPILGIVPAAAVASSHIPKKRLKYPDESLITNDSYYAGYTYAAHRKKVIGAWVGYATAAAIELFIGSIVLQAVFH